MERIMKLIRFILSYPKRFFNGVSFRAIVVDVELEKHVCIEKGTNIRYSSIGSYSYVGAGTSLIHTDVGKFCSIGGNVAIGGGAHDLQAVSTSPVFNSGRNIFNKSFANISFKPYKKTKIGNDVWIANRAIILQGVTIGDGAVIGAGAVVTKNVSPYAVVGGNPAKVIRYRFEDDIIQGLLSMKWWEWDESKLIEWGEYFDNPKELLERQMNED